MSTVVYLHYFTESSAVSPSTRPPLDQISDERTTYIREAQALHTEMKHCTEQVKKLSTEFHVIKRDIEEACKEIDTTRCALSEITMMLLSEEDMTTKNNYS